MSAQVRLAPEQMHERAIIVVPLAGTGTYAEPKRPLLAPTAAEMQANGIVSWKWEPSDNGQLAIVELAARDRSVLKPFVTSPLALKAFERGKRTRAEVEREIRLFKANFEIGKTVPGTVATAPVAGTVLP